MLKSGVIPQPQFYQSKEGICRVQTDQLWIQADPGALKEAQWLARYLGIGLDRVAGSGDSIYTQGPGILMKIVSQPDRGDEEYQLRVNPHHLEIIATGNAGLFYGIQTCLQMSRTNLYEASCPKMIEWPCGEIRDFPRFEWRGLMLDVSRHFMPVPFIKRFLDLMALHKLNCFHWHLTDDQGWRLESRAYPRLTEVGAVRASSPKPGDPQQDDGTPYGPYFYTWDEIREVVAYAEERHITVIPEIDLPGHVKAVLAAYPEMGCTGGPYEVRRTWGVEEDVLCIGNEAVFTFVEKILEEVFSLFPGSYIHIGGDEVPTNRWANCPRCVQLMKQEGMNNASQLQGYFTRRIVEFSAKRGRTVIGWDETLENKCPSSVTIMSWRGEQGGYDAAKAGLNAIMTPHTHCYFDYAESNEPGEPEAIGSESTSVEKTYGYNPIPEGLSPEEAKRILGVQGNVWTEYMWTERDVEYKVFPRACALAERAWSAPDVVEFPDFAARLQQHLCRLDAFQLGYRSFSSYSKTPVSS